MGSKPAGNCRLKLGNLNPRVQEYCPQYVTGNFMKRSGGQLNLPRHVTSHRRLALVALHRPANSNQRRSQNLRLACFQSLCPCLMEYYDSQYRNFSRIMLMHRRDGYLELCQNDCFFSVTEEEKQAGRATTPGAMVGSA